jgi:hypothetical protein
MMLEFFEVEPQMKSSSTCWPGGKNSWRSRWYCLSMFCAVTWVTVATVETLVDELLRLVVAEHLGCYADGGELAEIVVSVQELIYDRLVGFALCC